MIPVLPSCIRGDSPASSAHPTRSCRTVLPHCYCLPQEVQHLEEELARGVAAAADAGRKQKRKRHGFGGGVKGEEGGEGEEEGEEKDDKDSLMGDDSKEDGLAEGE